MRSNKIGQNEGDSINLSVLCQTKSKSNKKTKLLLKLQELKSTNTILVFFYKNW